MLNSKIICTLLLLAVITIPAYGQKQANIWYFGDHAGLDFNNHPPTPLLNGQTYFHAFGLWNEGSSSICDSSGALLFYTNGEKIWNRLQQIMLNGDSLMGHASSTQSSIILPQPLNDQYFYVFTTDAVENNFQNGLRYSIVDMCLDNKNGVVILNSKNILLTDSVNEKLIAIPHSNGTDYWIVVHKLYSDAFYSFRLTSTGVVDTIVSHSGTHDPNGVGQMKASPDGQKIAYCTLDGIISYTSVLDFDPSTGIVSNEQQLSPGNTEYATSFSADNSKLYFSTIGHGEIYQYNMNAGNISAIIASKTNLLYGPDSWRQIQLGPDGKLYLSRTGKPYLSVIEFPDSLVPACNYTDSAIYLGGQYASLGLPNYLAAFDYSNTIIQCHTGIPQPENSEQAIEVYPNPAVNELNIQNNSSRRIQFTLYNSLGEKIIDKTLTTKTSIIDLSSHSKGIYFYQLNNDKQLNSGKIIKL